MVCSVGLSPVPVVLGVLTCAPTLVFGVHSDTHVAVNQWKSIQRTVDEVLGENSPSFVDVVVPDEAVHDFTLMRDALKRNLRASLVERGVGAFLLDFTGGTTVMVSSLIEFQHRWFVDRGAELGDIDHWHSYVPLGRVSHEPVAGAAGNEVVLVGTNGRGRPLEYLLDSTPSLEQRARLNGFTLSGLSPDTEHCIHSRGGTFPPGRQRALEEVAQNWRTLTDRQRGRKAEAAWRDSLSLSLRSVEDQIDCNHWPTDWAAKNLEAWADITATKGRGEPFAQFDLLIRIGNTVIIGEVKASSLAGSSITASILREHDAAQQVFGSNTLVLFLPLKQHAIQGGLAEEVEVDPHFVRLVNCDPLIHNLTVDADTAVDSLREELRRLVSAAGTPRSPFLDLEGFELTTDRAEPHGDLDLPMPPKHASRFVCGIGSNRAIVEVVGETLSGVEDLRAISSVPSTWTDEDLPRTMHVVAPQAAAENSWATSLPGIFEEIGQEAMHDPEWWKGVIGYATPGTKVWSAALTQLMCECPDIIADVIHYDADTDRVVSRTGAIYTWKGEGALDWGPHLDRQLRRLLRGAERPVRCVRTSRHPAAHPLYQLMAFNCASSWLPPFMRGHAGAPVPDGTATVLEMTPAALGPRQKGRLPRFGAVAPLLPPAALAHGRRIVPILVAPDDDYLWNVMSHGRPDADESLRQRTVRRRRRMCLEGQAIVSSTLFGDVGRPLFVLNATDFMPQQEDNQSCAADLLSARVDPLGRALCWARTAEEDSHRLVSMERHLDGWVQSGQPVWSSVRQFLKLPDPAGKDTP